MKTPVFRSFRELYEHMRPHWASNTRGRGKPTRLPPAPKQPVLTSHQKMTKARTRAR